MIHRKDKKMRNKKKIKGLIKNILKNTLRVILSALISETNTAIDFNRLLKLILIEILFELLLYINSKDWRHFSFTDTEYLSAIEYRNENWDWKIYTKFIEYTI